MADLWFRMYESIVDDPKVQTLPAELFKWWVNFLAFAKSGHGYLPKPSEMAWTLRTTEKKVDSAIVRLLDHGLIDDTSHGLYMHNWKGRQFVSDSSTERVRKLRAAQRDATGERSQEQPCNVSPTVTETPSESRVQSTETENRVQTPLTPLAGGLSRKSHKRNYAQIAKDLGFERTRWFCEWWSAFPCKEGKRPAMDAFEQQVTSPEIWEKCKAGAIRYAAKARADPTMKLKYGQGWLNDARWDDEDGIPRVLDRPKGSDFVANVQRVIGERLSKGENPW